MNKPSRQLKYYRKKNGIPVDKPVKKTGKLHQIYCWNDECLTGHEWAEKLGICSRAFSRRLTVHGADSFRTFLTKAASLELQLLEHALPALLKSAKRKGFGNEEWAALGSIVLLSASAPLSMICFDRQISLLVNWIF